MNRTVPAAGQRPKRMVIVFYALTLTAAAALAGSIFLAPWLAASNSGLAPGVYGLFSRVCHQIPDRCFQFLGYPLAVCGRCLGIYLGFLSGCLVVPLVRGLDSPRLPGWRIFLGFSLPLAVDALGNGLRLWASGNWLRFATGFPWGLILPAYILAALSGLARGGLVIFRPSK